MLYHISVLLKPYFSPLNVVQYITFRAAAAFITALLISFFYGPKIIDKMRNLSLGESIRSDGPATHQIKAGTPTMGGIIILLAISVPMILWQNWSNHYVWLMAIGTFGMGLLGFWDDYIKVIRKNKKGVFPRYKLLWQLLISIIIGGALFAFPIDPHMATRITLPFFKDVYPNLYWLYFPFVFCVITGSSNATNLTDGLDGLAIGSITFTAIAMGIVCYLVGHSEFSHYLHIYHVPQAAELTVFLGAFLGACLGFLWFNARPAEIFMGDTGSLAIGGAMGTLAVLIKQELFLMIAAGLFVAEVLSVILQVGSYKSRRKRIFKMAPIHHHFELNGWEETKVVIRFWIVSAMFAVIALSTLKLR